ncbi:MAG: M48 family metalloprotease, partial [Planctomycetes bacterium]|nr:M48 family metalloprotease [Planctomycetota bacterium]
GVLHCILIIGIIGYFILRVFAFSGHRRRRSSKDGGSARPLMALGAGLMVIGFVGTFFGSWIKAALSRQREYLADASAVQFTRNPDGIAGALKKIGGCVHGAHIDSPNAPEASHMFFGQAVKIGLSSLFGTHPKLPDRIKRIDPSWTGKFTKVSIAAGPGSRATVAGVSGIAGTDTPTSRRKRRKRPPRRAKGKAKAGGGLGAIGRPTEAHIEYAATLAASIPKDVVEAARQPYGARAVIYALLIDDDANVRQKQLDYLARHSAAGTKRETGRLLPTMDKLDAKLRLPLIDITLSPLRSLSPKQYDKFKQNVTELIRADEKVDLFEWILQRSVLHHLDRHFLGVKPPRVKYYGLQSLGSECATLLATLARVGHSNTDDAQRAFDEAIKHSDLSSARVRWPSDEKHSLAALDKALDELAKAAPRCKKALLEACAVCVSADNEVTVREAELFRAVADALDCPMPPLLPGQPLN